MIKNRLLIQALGTKLMKILYWPFCISITIAIVSLGGCSSYVNNRLFDAKAKAITTLSDNHVQVIQRGEHVRLIIPSDYLFVFNSARIKPKANPVLNEVANLINEYAAHPVSVVIKASTDRIGSKEFKENRSLQQARHVAAYLWRHGVHHSQLKVIGRADTHPISANTVVGEAHNRRVEITLW